MSKPRIVKLRVAPKPGTEREYAMAATELSTTGHYRVWKTEHDAGTEWLYLQGGMTPYNSQLFDQGDI